MLLSHSAARKLLCVGRVELAPDAVRGRAVSGSGGMMNGSPAWRFEVGLEPKWNGGYEIHDLFSMLMSIAFPPAAPGLCSSAMRERVGY